MTASFPSTSQAVLLTSLYILLWGSPGRWERLVDSSSTEKVKIKFTGARVPLFFSGSSAFSAEAET